MKYTETYLEKRIQKNSYVPEDEYATGLLRLLQFLFCDLNELLEKEGRRFGIVLSYLNSIYRTYQKVEFNNMSDYNKIIYLLKPIIIRSYKRLCKRKVSEADSVIVLIKKILEIIDDLPEYKYNKEVKTLMKIITKLFDNIRNRNKNTSLNLLIGFIQTNMESGEVGKYELDHISLIEPETKKVKLEGTGIRIDEEPNKITEIVWKEE